MQFVKPPRLKSGDRIAILSPSSGAAHAYPHVLDLGIQNLVGNLGLEAVEFETCRLPNDTLYRDPFRRAQDINRAFLDPTINGIIATIGGDDSVRILPFLDLEAIQNNPKILMGYSDTTTLTSYLNQRGLITFNGPSVMAGFAQMRHLPAAFESHVKQILFDGAAIPYEAYDRWTDRYRDWNSAGYDGETAELQLNEGWHWLQGEGKRIGRLFGGCIEVFEFMKQTVFWPSLDFFDGRVLFFETSEEKPTVDQVKYMLRNYGSMGVLERIDALLFGRARSYTPEEKGNLDRMIERVVQIEFDRPDLMIVTNMDFGHTDPQWVLPQGIEVEIDSERKTFRMLEAAVK